ncbi:hypothetical protein OA90_26935 [Labrenzia sp. OB1]|nr:hypothetical protein OA90_26935 [Labrenzia sp. OB1]
MAKRRNFPAATLAHRQTLFPVNPVDLLPVGRDAFALQQNVQPAIAKAPALQGQFSEPLA